MPTANLKNISLSDIVKGIILLNPPDRLSLQRRSAGVRHAQMPRNIYPSKRSVLYAVQWS